MNNEKSVIASTPEQLRTRANDMDRKGHNWSGQPAHDFFEAATALRAAADQLEASRAWLDGQDSAEWDAVDLDGLDRILNGDSDD